MDARFHYQLSKGLFVEYDQESRSFVRFEFNEEPVDDEKIFTPGLHHFHFLNIEESLLSTRHQNAKGEGRLIVHRKK